MRTYLVQLVDLTLMQLTNWRWSWRGMVISGTIVPLFSTLAFGAFASGAGPEAARFILTGNMVVSLLFSTMGTVCGNFSYMRAVGRLDYFATLPVGRSALILATVAAFFALSLPSLIITSLLGALILNVRLSVSPWIVLVVPLITVSLAGLGALIGLSGRSPEEANSFNLLTVFILTGLGPVLIPTGRLPGFLVAAGYLSPSSYAASALREVVLNAPDGLPLAADVAALALFAVIFLRIAGRKMDWRRTE